TRLPDPETAYRTLFANDEHSFWLDASAVIQGLSRFAFMGDGSGPLAEYLTYQVGTGQVHVDRADGTSETVQQGFFDYLDDQLRLRKVPTPEGLPNDFNLGYVGYLGYELKAETGGQAVHPAETPDAALLFTDRMLVLDTAVQSGQVANQARIFALRPDARSRINTAYMTCSFIGGTVGSWLGAHYAQRFPRHTGRFVLDSNTEFTTTWQRSFDWQPLGFERRWREDFLPWMARYDSTYHFGTTGDTVRQVYEHVRDALTREPVDVGTVHVTAPKLDELTVSFLYQKSLFPTLATILVTLRDLTGQGTADIQKAETALTKPMATDFMRATFWANLCGEGPWTGNRRTAVRDSDHAYDSGLTLVGGAWPLGQVCMFWTAPPRPLPTMDGKGVPPVLMLQSTHDPATPV
ncbi:alpha/beta hydrolase, partial [Kibdelosporangium lantanae]